MRLTTLPPSSFGILLVGGLLIGWIPWSQAWVYPALRGPTAITGLSASLSGSQNPVDSSILGGVEGFERWFRQLDKAECKPTVQHDSFGSLRGLSYSGASLNGNKEVVLKIPKSSVLRSSYDDPDWDLCLAESLWEECLKGSSSEIQGYCSLLTRGAVVSTADFVPPYTAPNALRHWTESQRERLNTSDGGKELLALQSRQEKRWREKYARRRNAGLTWEQFEWSMEAVHSRAFCGQFGSSLVRNVWSVAAPLGAALGCIKAVFSDGELFGFDGAVYALLAIAASPLVINLALPEPPQDVVLLPLIDSANHMESADSSIAFDPLGNTFSLEIGPNCLVPENDGKKQLYISYGPKSPKELLLNYGFLPNVPCSEGLDDASRDEQREQLAAEFTK